MGQAIVKKGQNSGFHLAVAILCAAQRAFAALYVDRLVPYAACGDTKDHQGYTKGRKGVLQIFPCVMIEGTRQMFPTKDMGIFPGQHRCFYLFASN